MSPPRYHRPRAEKGRVGKGALRRAELLASAVVRLCPRCPTLPLDRVGKVARAQCAMRSAEAGDFAHPTLPYDRKRSSARAIVGAIRLVRSRSLPAATGAA
jgi:hypothetical protein